MPPLPSHLSGPGPLASCSSQLGGLLAGLFAAGRRNQRPQQQQQQQTNARLLQQGLRPTQLDRQRGMQELLIGPRSVADGMEASLQETSLTARWRKDKARSDDMQEACDAVALPWVSGAGCSLSTVSLPALCCKMHSRDSLWECRGRSSDQPDALPLVPLAPGHVAFCRKSWWT